MNIAPSSHSSLRRRIATGAATGTLALILAQLGLVACFNSDEKVRSSDDVGSESSETNAMYSDETAQDTDDNWTAEESGPGETTCRDAIDCLVMCQALLLFNMDPEPDLSCFLECDMGLSVDEAYALLKLGECIATQCSDDGQCGGGSETDGTETGPTDEDCLICIAAFAQDPEPPGCMAEAAACD